MSLADFPNIPEVRRSKIRTAALAFRIWQFAMDRGWDVTMTETAEALNVPPQTVSTIATNRRWLNRFRSTKPQNRGLGAMGTPLSYDLYDQPDMHQLTKGMLQ